MNREPTSRDVPCSKTRSDSDHIVGMGIGRGKNLVYSVHGVEVPTLDEACSCVDRTMWTSRYSITSFRVDSYMLATDVEA